MPDIILVFERRWKFILGLTIAATVVAIVVAMVMPKQYLSVATALPANSANVDKARIFNDNIEALYPEVGLPDELDRFEGTAALDTIYIETSKDMNLQDHYLLGNSPQSEYDAAMRLKKNSSISRTAYGEIQIKVWDKNPGLAAEMANTVLRKIQLLHQHLQSQNNSLTLEKIKENYKLKQDQFRLIADTLLKLSGADAEIWQAKKASALAELEQYDRIIDKYQLAIKTNPQVLLTVEPARASVYPDKPRILQTGVFSFFGAFTFAFLVGLFLESRKK
jgi:tetratricopeptide (TPR) repeat protein